MTTATATPTHEQELEAQIAGINAELAKIDESIAEHERNIADGRAKVAALASDLTRPLDAAAKERKALEAVIADNEGAVLFAQQRRDAVVREHRLPELVDELSRLHRERRDREVREAAAARHSELVAEFAVRERQAIEAETIALLLKERLKEIVGALQVLGRQPDTAGEPIGFGQRAVKIEIEAKERIERAHYPFARVGDFVFRVVPPEALPPNPAALKKGA